MTDIIDRIRERTHDLRLDIECLLDDCITEIESLRQEVIDYRSLSELSQCKIEELENRINTIGHGIILINKEKESLRAKVAELESLKASQGEPVAWMDNDGNVSDWNCEGAFSIPLYTSAPTIPEGWKLVPIRPTKQMILAAVKEQSNRTTVPSDDALAAGNYYAMLAAAPEYKGEE